MKRFLALLLTLVMLLSLLPTAIAAPQKGQKIDVWEEICRMEDRATAKCRAADTTSRTAAYSEIVDQIIQVVVSSEDYVPESLVRHGDFFFWDSKDGTGNGYSPRLRAKIRESAQPDADPEAFAETSTVSYAERGGSPSSAKVAVFQPYIGIDASFSAQYENEGKSIAQTLGGTATIYKTNNATIDNIAQAMETCGVVIFDSHGDTDYANGKDYTTYANTSYICLQSGTGITAADQESVPGAYGTPYKHAYYGGSYGSMQYYMVDGTAISNHMTSTSPNGLLWMAICLGMATDGLEAPLREKGVEVVYGYSQSVTFSGDYDWEAKFWGKMKNGSNVKDAIAYMKQTIGCPDPYASSRPAYPITVSSEDTYPGHGNVDKAQTVYSTWTLFTQYQVEAVSNNSNWGTVSVTGCNITATPAAGYYVDGYEILEGQATVKRNGNVFTVTPASDCTIQVNFASKDAAVVSFSVPDGVACDSINAYVGDIITLPMPTGVPAVEGRSYRFLGWASAPTGEDSMTLPEFLQVGTKVKLTAAQTTYYALYSYRVAFDGLAEDAFVRVDKEPASWMGEYVLSFNGQYALNATSKTVRTEICSKDAVMHLEKLGCAYEDNLLRNVVDDITYVVSASQNGTYTVKMKNANYYLAMDKAANSMTTFSSSTTDKTRWKFKMTDGGVVLTNAAYENYALQYVPESGVFCPRQEEQAPLTLFVKADGVTWYTTQPKDLVICEEHSFGAWTTTTSPSCTEAGSKYHVCTVCGTRVTESIDPLGHNYATVVTAPTCLKGGYSTYTCTRCSDTYTGDETEALGHDYATEVTAPTCLEGGYTTYTCMRCSDTYTGDETEAPGHDYATEVTAPTCLEGGYTTYTCTRCSDTYTSDETEALGHDWDDGVVTLQPTTVAEGVMTYTCNRCVETKTEAIPVLNWVNPFVDVKEEDPFFMPVLWAVNHEPQITAGTDANHFTSEKVVSRAEAMMFLYAAKGRPAYETPNVKFKDVSKKHWAYSAVMWAVSNGITGGTGEGKFTPTKDCNRSEILTFLYAAMEKPEYTINNPYSDVKNKHWYKDSAIWAYENGLEKGNDGKFEANTPTTRAAIVTYLYRFETGLGLAE